jgi:signal transduction histidine kinase
MTKQYLLNLRLIPETNTFRLIRQMRDYSKVGADLILKRQIIFAAALALAGFYYSVPLAVSTLGLIIISEGYDYFVFKEILLWRGRDPSQARKFLYKLYFGTVLSASIIAFYAIGIAYIQGPAMHFMPMFFLFAAALFAAMNNHHLIPVLVIRLSIYGAAFLFIPIWDIAITGADIHSELWEQLFVSLFVLYFIIDCSRIYLNFYQNQLAQFDLLEEEVHKSRMAYKAQSEFLSTMSHELRTPLTSIKGSVDLASSGLIGELPPKVGEVLHIAQRNCSTLARLINDILDQKKIEFGKMEYKMQPFNIVAPTQDAISANLPMAEILGVNIVFDKPKDPIVVNADKLRLEQVFTNILSNAAKFSPDGSTVTVSIERLESTVRVLFADQGIGLNEDQYEIVFGKFRQVDPSDTRKMSGTGLGMSISKQMVTALGGSIGYRSNSSVGTTFFVDLPLASDQTKV